jgi:hypothetical protein
MAEREIDPDAVVTVASYRELWKAHLARSILESEGIPATVADENIIGLELLISDAFGGARVQVLGADLERARLILEDYWRGNPKPQVEDGDTQSQVEDGDTGSSAG